MTRAVSRPFACRSARARLWGTLPDDRQVHRWTLRNAQGMQVDISDLGASLVSWWVPDRDGRLDDVLLGHATPADYLRERRFMGGVVGRWANRIAHGEFRLDGATYRLDRNDRGHHLHGGNSGFHHALWQVSYEGQTLLLTLQSPHGQGGFPGNLAVELRYTLHEDGALALDYRAWTDQATPVNLTAHPYFNLGGRRGNIDEHVLRIDAPAMLTVDAGMIPCGQSDIAGTPFDFRQPAALGPRLAARLASSSTGPNQQLALAGGFDHCYCLGDGSGHVRPVATAFHPPSGRRLTLSTDQPGLQFYTGQHLTGAGDRLGGTYDAFDGFCLEAQVFPDQINSPLAEHCVLRPGGMYRQRTTYRLDLP